MRSFFILLITLSPSLITQLKPHSYWVIWNVGQGQWVSNISLTECHHFDMGGEFFPWKKIHKACAGKRNIVSLSHWDWDHICALSKIKSINQLGSVCIAHRPLGAPPSRRKKQLLANIQTCPQVDNKISSWTPTANSSSNAKSQVFFFRKVLIPGDSPSSEERKWLSQSWLNDSKVLILGHHGSATSTSKELLQRLPHLKMSISSARWARYKHPHSKTEVRLGQFHIPLLRTEDWGNIWIEDPQYFAAP